jgi:hypothetical protein
MAEDCLLAQPIERLLWRINVQVCRVVWPIACACFYSLTPTLPLLALFKNNLHSLVTIAETIAIMASGKESSGSISETK